MIIRPLQTAAELRACVALQESTWGPGFSERVPYAVLWFSRRIGGVLLGAFDGAELVGFVFGLTGLRDGRPLHWSDMLAVRSDARDRGIGVQLKLAQREALLQSGVPEAHWTFDPLESRNAYLNLCRLGVIAREYVRDVYGASDSPLHGVIGTDRLVAEWHVESPRVEHRVRHAPRAGAARDAPAVNHVAIRGGVPCCGAISTALDDPTLALLIPASIQDVKTHDVAAARAWRSATREAFEHYLQQGYVATELVRRTPQVSAYLLERDFSF